MTNQALPTRFRFSHSGDPSVGIGGEEVIVEYVGEFFDKEYQEEFVNSIREALSGLMDGKIRVTPEHSHTCAICSKVFIHLDDYCEPFCGNECETKHEEVTKAEIDMWSASEEGQKVITDFASGNIDTDLEYFRTRNERALRGINGAGIRN